MYAENMRKKLQKEIDAPDMNLFRVTRKMGMNLVTVQRFLLGGNITLRVLEEIERYLEDKKDLKDKK